MIPIVIFLRKKPKQPNNVDFSYNAAYVSTFLASAIFPPPTPEDPFP